MTCEAEIDCVDELNSSVAGRKSGARRQRHSGALGGSVIHHQTRMQLCPDGVSSSGVAGDMHTQGMSEMQLQHMMSGCNLLPPGLVPDPDSEQPSSAADGLEHGMHAQSVIKHAGKPEANCDQDQNAADRQYMDELQNGMRHPAFHNVYNAYNSYRDAAAFVSTSGGGVLCSGAGNDMNNGAGGSGAGAHAYYHGNNHQRIEQRYGSMEQYDELLRLRAAAYKAGHSLGSSSGGTNNNGSDMPSPVDSGIGHDVAHTPIKDACVSHAEQQAAAQQMANLYGDLLHSHQPQLMQHVHGVAAVSDACQIAASSGLGDSQLDGLQQAMLSLHGHSAATTPHLQHGGTLVRQQHAVRQNSLTPRPSTSHDRHRDSPVNIPKVQNDLGFQYSLEAPISTMVRADEDRMTYVNKGQYYTVTLDYLSAPTGGNSMPGPTVRSVLLVVFRDEKTLEEEMKCWRFWHARQQLRQQRILDVDQAACSGMVAPVESPGLNAVQIEWRPLESPATLSIAVQCLSTDFSNQKGVRGLPLHLQIDTYDDSVSDTVPFHRGYCQIKVFCDKGANRKMLHETRRSERRRHMGRKKHDVDYHPPVERSDFYHMSNLDKQPAIFTAPDADEYERARLAVLSDPLFQDPATCAGGSVILPVTSSSGASGSSGPGAHDASPLSSLDSAGEQPTSAKRSRWDPGLNAQSAPPGVPAGNCMRPPNRVLLFVRKPDESIYSPLHVLPPGVAGLQRAIANWLRMDVGAVGQLFKQCVKGNITVQLDDDQIALYHDGDYFVLVYDNHCATAAALGHGPPAPFTLVEQHRS